MRIFYVAAENPILHESLHSGVRVRDINVEFRHLQNPARKQGAIFGPTSTLMSCTCASTARITSG